MSIVRNVAEKNGRRYETTQLLSDISSLAPSPGVSDSRVAQSTQMERSFTFELVH
jgi:hypothetical protein